MAKARIGTGARFAALKEKLSSRMAGMTPRGRKMAAAMPGRTEKAHDAAALAAWIGRKKYGEARMARMSAAGRKRN